MKVSITESGQWLLAIGQNQEAIIYEYSGGSYVSFDTILGVDSFYTGDITEDHEFVFIGKANGGVDVYKHDGSSYQFLEELMHSSDIINSLDVSDDGMFLGFAPIDEELHIYRYNGISYNHLQTITFANSATRYIHFNPSNQLVISDTFLFKYMLYKYNDENFEFESSPIQNESTFITPVLQTTILDDTLIVTTQL